MGSWLSSPFPFKINFFIFKTSFSAFTAYRGRGLVNLQCHRLKSRDVSTRVVEENFRNVTLVTRSSENFRRALFACPCAYVHNFIPLHWKCKDIYLCRQRKLKQVSLPLSRPKADRIQGWVASKACVDSLVKSTPALFAGSIVF